MFLKNHHSKTPIRFLTSNLLLLQFKILLMSRVKISMRALVEEIDSYAELIALKITSNPISVQGQTQPQLQEPNLQSTVDAAPSQLEQPQDPTF